MPFTIVRNDITKMDVDAVVNASNTALQIGGGVCGAIFKAAGADALAAACRRLAPIETGQAVITPGFGLPARYIIHTAGPVYRGGGQGEAALLRACYHNALALAARHGCRSVAFPLISGGIFGYPKQAALRIATETIQVFLAGHDMDICLTVFDRETVRLSEALFDSVQRYIDQRYVDMHWEVRRSQSVYEGDSAIIAANSALRAMETAVPAPAAAQAPASRLEDLVDRLDEPFSGTLLRLIDAKGKTDVEVYKRANLDRKLFSKIRTGKHYTPGKRTVLALAIALELTLPETEDLLRRAGYALSPSHKQDVIIEYFIVNGNYDVFELNEVLFYHDQPLLGG